MLIEYAIFFLVISIGKSILTDPKYSVEVQAMNASLLDAASSFHHPPRKDGIFDFDFSEFDDFSIFNSDKTRSHDSDSKGISSSVPSSPSKVTRSATNYDTYDRYFKPSSPTQTVKYNVNQQLTPQKPLVPESDTLSNENQSSLNGVSNSNRGTIPYFGSVAAYSADPSVFHSTNAYKSLLGVPFNGKLSSTDYMSTIPEYPSLTQAPEVTRNYRAQKSEIQNIPYKTESYQDIKLLPSKMYIGNHHHRQYRAPFNSKGLSPQITHTISTINEKNNKRFSIPVTPLQANLKYPSYFQPRRMTSLYGSKSDVSRRYKPSYSGNFYDLNLKGNNQRTEQNIPFLSNTGSSLTQVLPIHAASSSYQFPRYHGASFSQTPSRGISMFPDEYQDFQSQTHLHFNGDRNKKFNNHPVFDAREEPFQRIRTDVEIIDKTKPIPPITKDGDDSDDDKNDFSRESYNDDENYSSNSEENASNESPRYNNKKTESKEHLRPIKLFSLQDYDDKLSTEKTSSNNGEVEDDADGKLTLGAKYHYFDKYSDEDNDKAAEYKNNAKLKAYPSYNRFVLRINDESNDVGGTKKKKNVEKSEDLVFPYGVRKQPRARGNTKYKKEKDDALRNNNEPNPSSLTNEYYGFSKASPSHTYQHNSKKPLSRAATVELHRGITVPQKVSSIGFANIFPSEEGESNNSKRPLFSYAYDDEEGVITPTDTRERLKSPLTRWDETNINLKGI